MDYSPSLDHVLGSGQISLPKDIIFGIITVDEYLKTCKRIGREPEKPFSGRFMVRIPSELHCAIALAAKRERKSINAWIAEICEQNVFA